MWASVWSSIVFIHTHVCSKHQPALRAESTRLPIMARGVLSLTALSALMVHCFPTLPKCHRYKPSFVSCLGKDHRVQNQRSIMTQCLCHFLIWNECSHSLRMGRRNVWRHFSEMISFYTSFSLGLRTELLLLQLFLSSALLWWFEWEPRPIVTPGS